MAKVELKTYGDVKQVINKMTKSNIFSNVKGVLADEALNLTVVALSTVVPGIVAAKKAYDVFRALGSRPDTKKTDTWLDKLDIGDETAAIVDDTVEAGFFQELADTLSRIPDDTPLDDSFSMEKRFQEYLQKKYENHYVAPVTETKMKRSQLVEIIREVIGGYEPDGKGNLVRHNDKFDSVKLSALLKDLINRGNQGEQEGEDPIYEEASNGVGIMLNDLTADKIKEIFPKFGERYGGIHFPNPSDSLTSVYDERSLEQWKDGTREEYGNVEVMFYPQEDVWFNKVKINDPQFTADKEVYTKRKAGWLDGERGAGRTSGLD